MGTFAAVGQKGTASDQIIFQALSTTQAAAAIQAGKIDVYDFALSPTLAASLQGQPGIKLITAPSAFDDLIFNPAPVYIANLSGDQSGMSRSALAAKYNAPVGAITNVYYDSKTKLTSVEFGAFTGLGANPFAFKAIRFAMNYLVDRDTAVGTTFAGQAAGMYASLGQFDPDYTVVADIILKYKFAYNPQLTSDVVNSVLTAAGARLSGGKWTYEGNSIPINFIIRIEDQRLDMGNAFASQLDALGFATNRIYLTFGPALAIAQGTDPKLFKWHIYTEGFSKNGIAKYTTTSPAQYYAPWFGQMPGRGQTAWWNYRNSTLDTTTQRIFQANFTSQDQRNQLLRQAMEMGMQETVRTFQVTQLATYPVSTNLAGITVDVGAGLRSIFDVREWYVPGSTATLNVGHNHVYTATTVWNEIGGFGDVYSVDPYQATRDPWTTTDPFSGLPIPFRASFAVLTAGPTGKLSVPSDAFIWDATSGSWTTVPAGTQSISRVNFDLTNYIGTKWHDGTTFSWGDVVANIAQSFDLAYNKTKASLDPTDSTLTKTTTDQIAGFKIFPQNKSISVYINYWHFSSNYIAQQASQSFLLPYQLTLATDSLVFNQKTYAYSQSAAKASNVPWLNLVLSGHAADVATKLKAFAANNYFPTKMFTIGSTTYSTPAEAVSRYQAAMAWITAHGVAWISDGPAYLNSFSAQGDTLTLNAWRDPTYPYAAGKWVQGYPPAVKIVEVGLPSVTRGQTANVLVDLKGPPPLHVEYILRDSVKGTILSVGQGSVATGSRFSIVLDSGLTSKLTATFPYEMTILAYSDAVASVDSSTQFLNVFDAGLITSPIQSSLNSTQSSITTQAKAIADLGTKIDALSSTLGATIQSLNSTANLQLYAIVAVVIVQIAILAIVFTSRKR